ncbi:MAG: DUF3806 domain-containing protein [Halieaceae bacterium]
MTKRAYLPLLQLAALILTLTTGAWAMAEVEIGTLSYLDRSYMKQQRERIGDLSLRNLGRSLNGTATNDLAILQALLDKKLVTGDQKLELQAMGVVMGDLLAADLGLDWVIYEDKVGRSRALRYRQTDNYLFPMTMISRRREVGNTDTVADIYQKAHASMAAVIEPLPFQ